jgi:hypothetical protein
MITAVVTFKLPPEMSREKWQENIKQVSNGLRTRRGDQQTLACHRQ